MLSARQQMHRVLYASSRRYSSGAVADPTNIDQRITDENQVLDVDVSNGK